MQEIRAVKKKSFYKREKEAFAKKVAIDDICKELEKMKGRGWSYDLIQESLEFMKTKEVMEG